MRIQLVHEGGRASNGLSFQGNPEQYPAGDGLAVAESGNEFPIRCGTQESLVRRLSVTEHFDGPYFAR